MMNYSSILFSVMFLISCQSNSIDESASPTLNSIDILLDTPAIEIVNEKYPNQFDNIYELFATGFFHEDEVPENFQQKEWFALNLSANEAKLEFVQLLVERVHDPLLDEHENIKTGWSIQIDNMDEPVFLFENHKMLPLGVIKHIPVEKAAFYPGIQWNFEFNSNNYSLKATGHRDMATDEITNYRLTLTRLEDGISTLLIAHPYFSDEITTILFVGDLNDDGAPDFIINGSYHYNVFEPILFMSTSTSDLVIPYAKYTVTGC
jgi:hypothetical protein